MRASKAREYRPRCATTATRNHAESWGSMNKPGSQARAQEEHFCSVDERRRTSSVVPDASSWCPKSSSLPRDCVPLSLAAEGFAVPTAPQTQGRSTLPSRRQQSAQLRRHSSLESARRHSSLRWRVERPCLSQAMIRAVLATTRGAALRVRKGTRLAPPSCSVLRSELLQRLGGGTPEVHSTGGVPAGLRSIQLPLESSKRPPMTSPSEQRRLRKAERRVRRHEAKRKARQLAKEATAQRMAARQALLDAMSDKARAYLAASPWLPTFLSLASVLALGPALALARRSSPSSKPSGGSGGPTSRASAAVA